MNRGLYAQEKKMETCQKIIDVATELFSCNSYDVVTMRDVAKKADISLALLSYHFETKKNLYLCCLLHKIPDIERWRSRIMQRVDKDPSLEKYVKAFFLPCVELVKNNEIAGKHYLSLLCRVSKECKDIAIEAKKCIKFQMTDIYYQRFKQYMGNVSDEDFSWLTHIAHVMLYCSLAKCNSQLDQVAQKWNVLLNDSPELILEMVTLAYLRIIRRYVPVT